MPVYTVQTPTGHHMEVEAPDEATALSGTAQWWKENWPPKSGNSAPGGSSQSGTDLSSLSDDELKALYAVHDNVSKMSDAELKAAYAAHTANDPKADTSVTSALTQGLADTVSGYGKTLKDYVSPEVGDAILASRVAKGNPNYKSASEEFIHPADGADNHRLGLDWSALPRAAVEQAPGLAVDLAGQYLTKNLGPVGQYIANAVTYGGRTLGGEAEKRAAARTGDPNAEPTAEDKVRGLESVVAQMALHKIGTNSIVSPSKVTATGAAGAAHAGWNVLKAGLTEGATSAGQDLISQSVAKQGTDAPYDTAETLGAGVTGAVSGGAFSGVKGGRDALTAIRMSDQTPDVHTVMAANRILQRVKAAGELKDPSTAYKATSAAISDVSRELGDAANGLSTPSPEAVNAVQRAKAGEALNQRDLDAVDAERNDQVSSLVRQASALSKLTELGNYNDNAGTFTGGAHQTVKKLAWPLVKEGGKLGVLAAAVGGGGVGLDTVASHLPGAMESAAGAYAAYRAVKAVDRALGLSSPARTFAERFGDDTGNVRVAPAPLNQSQTGPKVAPPVVPQPWGPAQPTVQPFKPDLVEPGIGKIVSGIQRQKQQQTARDAMPLLRQLAQQAQPAPQPPGIDANAVNEQIKGALLMASARRKIAGQQQAETEAAASPLINGVGGLGAVANPAVGKRASELISAANALKKLRTVPEADSTEAPTAPEVAESTSPQPQASGAPDAPEPFVLPESHYWHLDAHDAADAILQDALAGDKPIRNVEAYHAGTVRRLKAEEDIYSRISNALTSVQERGAFHKYLAALWGSDAPEVVQRVRDHMLGEFPQHEGIIRRHLSDEAIKALWNSKSKRK